MKEAETGSYCSVTLFFTTKSASGIALAHAGPTGHVEVL